MKKRLLFIVIFVLGFMLLVGGLSWLNGQLLQHVDAGEHFLVSWTRAQAFVLNGENPYSESVTQEVQVAVYGRYAKEGEYTYVMDVPFYKLFAYFPFALIKDFDLAFALWMSIAELALLGIGILSVQLTGWKPSTLETILFYLTVLFSFYSFYSILGGSGSVFTALFLLLMLFALHEGWDEGLGILLLLGTFHLAKGGVFFLLLLGWIVYQRRWRVFSVLGMSLVVIVVISFLILPEWLSSYYEAISAGALQNYGFTIGDLLQRWMPNVGDIAGQIFRWVFMLILLVECFNLRKGRYARLLWVSALSIVIIPFLNLSVSPYFFALLIFPLPLLLKNIGDRWQKLGRWISPLLLVLVLSLWLLFLHAEKNALQILVFAYPSFLLITLYWMRWWSLRLPHTWEDELKKYQ